MIIQFYKYQGTGNDFVVLDNRNGAYESLSSNMIFQLCHRRKGIGADGLMMLNHSNEVDFEMKYYNADGNPGSMCGNGGRCIVQFAHDIGIKQYTYQFLAVDGMHLAEIEQDGLVKLKMNDVHTVAYHQGYAVLDTGSPHFVKWVHDLDHVDVYQSGKEIRYSKTFAEKGINVNFVENLEDNLIFVRTYERGVEDETMSCGTGVTACALLSAHHQLGFNKVDIKTTGGMLSVEYNRLNDQHFEQIWLSGPAVQVFKGEIEI